MKRDFSLNAKPSRSRHRRLAVVLLAAVLVQSVVPPLPALAQYGFDTWGYSEAELNAIWGDPEAFGEPPPKVATDETGNPIKTKDEPNIFFKVAEWLAKNAEKYLKGAAAVAYKQALSYFLRRLAVDTATQLAEGGKGRKPLYETEGWGAYIARVGDSAAGHFIQSFAAGVGLPNLCRPRFDVKFKLTLGLLDAALPPEEPLCTFTQLAGNWEQFHAQFIDNPERLHEIMRESFSPNQNDFGIGIGMWSNFYSVQAEAHEEQILSRLEKAGFKDVVDIAGKVLTPGTLIKEYTVDALSPKLQSFPYLIYTGEAVADAVDAFSSTLVSKLLIRLYQKGFARSSSKPEKFDWSKLEGLRSPTADPNASRGDARQDFESFFATGLAIGDPRLNRLDVTSVLVGDGVISPLFKTAIDRKLTVRQAIAEGLMFGDGAGATFGYSRAGTELNANDGYAYAALVILRKYRILPVGWELAAAYIGQLEQKRVYSLNDIIRGFSQPGSPFYGLVDDGWVLKAPETYCRLNGPGDRLTSVSAREETILLSNKPPDSVTGQLPSYQFTRRTVSRDNTCTDARSCIVEDANGNCRAYGQCTQEQPIWKFAGTQCPPQYDSCRSYEDDQNRAVSYLGDTLEAGSCDANAVGCQWYCRDFNIASGVWACVSEGERVRKPCQQLGRCSGAATACATDAGCPRGETCRGASCLATDVATGVSCAMPYGAVSCTVPGCGAAESFVANGGFESESADLTAQAGKISFAANWSTSAISGGSSRFARVAGVNNQVAAGSYAVRLDPDGTVSRLEAVAGALTVPATVNPPFTVTARVYSTLLFGRAFVEVVPTSGTGCSTVDADYAKGQWATVSCATSDVLVGASLRLVVEGVAGINPVGAVWFDDVRIERACPLQAVTVYLEGTREADGSKLYFDRDVSICSQEESGCRALTPTGQGGVNLVYNASFEEWPDPSSQMPPGWVNHAGDTVARVADQSAVGQNHLRYTATAARDNLFSSDVISGVQAGRTYQVSLYAKAGAPSNAWQVTLAGHDRGVRSLQNLVAQGQGKCYDGNARPPVPLIPALACRRDADCNPPAPGAPLPGANPNFCHGSLPLTKEWQRFVFEPIEARVSRNDFYLLVGSTAAGTLALDGVQVTAVAPRSAPADLAYSDYRDNPIVHFKTPPAYLGCTGDPQTDHSACGRYSLVCRSDEVSCERYTPTNGEPPLPAITGAGDQCPAACVDYSAFSQTAGFFSEAIPSPANPDFLYFIARTGRTCDAQSVGCEQFTNLDEVAKGGEGRGSYTYLRQCTKPDANVCQPYYTWVGSEVSGYQLKSYTLRRDANGADPQAPDVAIIPNLGALGNCQYNGKEQAACSAPGDAPDVVGGVYLGCHNPADAARNAQTNPNCREFYATNGLVYYRLLKQTVACSDDCHPFRLIDSTQTACEGSGGYWGVCSGAAITDCVAQGGMQLVGGADCYLRKTDCETAGATFAARNECIYQAVPNESQSCPAAEAGCREYRGNAGGNLRTVFYDDFEDGDTLGWSSGVISSDAVTVGGHSISSNAVVSTLAITVPCAKTLVACAPGATANCYDQTTTPPSCRLFAGGQECRARDGEPGCGLLSQRMAAGRNYQLSFWAKASRGVVTVDVKMVGVGCGQPGISCALRQDLRVADEWEEYTSQPILVQSISPAAQLNFTFSVGYSLAVDFVALTEVQDYNYLVKNSWRTPQICDTDPTLDQQRFPGPNSPQFALGCQEYTASGGQTMYLKSFQRLCRDSSVGCEEFIDTQNSTSALAEQFNAGQAQAAVAVFADRLAYYVRDVSKECAAAAAGCQTFGLPTPDAQGHVNAYQTRYLINHPERYGTSLCTVDQVGCREYVSPQVGTVYFRDPGSRTCESKQIPHRQDYGWFIAGSASAVPDCPTVPTRFGQSQPGKTCQGGDLNGQACASDAACSFKVCRGGTAEGARCADAGDCSGGVCEPQPGACRPWVGQCPAEYSSCTAYVDPLSDPQVGLLPNGNFEGFFRLCSHDGQTVCRLDADCLAASAGLRFCPNSAKPCSGPDDCGGDACNQSSCSVSQLNTWVNATPENHQPGQGVNGGSALRLTRPTPVGQEVRTSLGLSGGTLYTVAAAVKNSARDAAIVVTTADGSKQPIFTQFDHSVAIFSSGVLATRGDTAVLPVGGVGPTSYRRFSGRFFALSSDRAVAVKIQNAGTYDNVDLKPTGVYHYLADSIERSACNGVYDPAQGCVLVNDTSDPTLQFSTSATLLGQPPSVCQPQQCVGGPRSGAACTADGDCGAGGVCRPGTCDANLLVKVAPDRTCVRWLDCISSRKQVNFLTGQVQEFCQQLATCDRLDPITGRCSSYPTEELRPLTFDSGSVQLAQALTGSAKVGFRWDDDTHVDGYFPYGMMTQRKVCVGGTTGAVCLEHADCNTENSRDGVCQPVLQVGPDPLNDVIYESCRVYPSSSAPRWTAQGPVDTGDAPAKSVVVDINDPLTRPSDGSLMPQAALQEASECHYVQGRSEILGVYGFCVEKDPRSPYLCLNWLPVDELTGGWIGITGWRDNLRSPLYYCTESATLETRRPRRKEVNKCYKRDFFDIDLGDFAFMALFGPAGQLAYAKHEAESKRCGRVICPPGYIGSVSDSSCGNFFESGIRCRWRCEPDTADLYGTDEFGVRWYDWIPRLNREKLPTKQHLMYCPKCGRDGTVVWDPEDPQSISGWDNFSREEQQRHPQAWARVCEKFVTVVAPDGANRGWKERLEAIQDFQGANYQVPDLKYQVGAINAPFGAISRQYQGDPTQFPLIQTLIPAADFDSPLYPTYPGGSSGQMYYDKYYGRASAGPDDLQAMDTVPVSSFHAGRERLKRLFATSYGDFRWNAGAYVPFTVGENYCQGGPRDGQDCDPNVISQCADNPPSTCNRLGGFCTYVDSTETNQPNDEPELSCDSDTICQQAPNKPFCAYGNCGSFSDNNELNDSDRPCRLNTDCAPGEDCSNTIAVYGTCVAKPPGNPEYRRAGIACINESACDTRADLDDGTCQDIKTKGYCSHGVVKGLACASDSDCNPLTQVARCVGSCSLSSANPNGRCTQDSECRFDGKCTSTNAWKPPAQRCPGNIRPESFTDTIGDLTDLDLTNNGDWCAVTPEVFNVKLENAEAPIFYAVGQANVTLSFNVKVDANQLPLQLLRIQWDMEKRDQAVAENNWRSGMRDKADPRDPFLFTHTFKYEQSVCDKGVRAGGANPLPDGYCQFQIGIMVRDNWCWCSNSTDRQPIFAGVNPSNLACEKCAEDVTPDNASDNNGAWIESPSAIVRICAPDRPDLCGRAP